MAGSTRERTTRSSRVRRRTGQQLPARAVPEGSAVKVSELIHPKVEPEIAFVTKADLRGPGCNIATVLAATDFVMPAIEVIDSRYRDFKFDLKSVIADNTSAARFVVGGTMKPVDGMDLKTTGIVLEKNGVPVAFGAGAAVVGHPAAAIASRDAQTRALC